MTNSKLVLDVPRDERPPEKPGRVPRPVRAGDEARPPWRSRAEGLATSSERRSPAGGPSRAPRKCMVEAGMDKLGTKETIDHIEDLMRHRNPTGDLETILDASFALLLAKLEKERLGKTPRPGGRRRKPAETTSACATHHLGACGDHDSSSDRARKAGVDGERSGRALAIGDHDARPAPPRTCGGGGRRSSRARALGGQDEGARRAGADAHGRSGGRGCRGGHGCGRGRSQRAPSRPRLYPRRRGRDLGMSRQRCAGRCLRATASVAATSALTAIAALRVDTSNSTTSARRRAMGRRRQATRE